MIRTNKPSKKEITTDRFVELANRMSISVLAQTLGRSPGTAQRRRKGKGWTVSEVLRVADFHGVSPGSLVSE